MYSAEYNVLPDDGLQKGPKHVAVIIHTTETLLCLMGENSNISCNVINTLNGERVRRFWAR